MTTTDIYAHFQAYCALDTREICTDMELPQSISPRAFLQITDVSLFVSTSLNRLDAAPILARTAQLQLHAFINIVPVKNIEKTLQTP